MKTFLKKILVVYSLIALPSTLISSPEAWGRLFGKVAGTAGAGLGSSLYAAHRWPEAVKTLRGQSGPSVSDVQTSMLLESMKGLRQSNYDQSASLRYQQRKDIFMGTCLVVGSVVVLDYFTNGKIRRAITQAKNEIITYVGKQYAELGKKVTQLSTSVSNGFSTLKSWTGKKFNKLNLLNKKRHEENKAQQKAIQADVQQGTERIVRKVDTSDQKNNANHARTHQLLEALIDRDTTTNTTKPMDDSKD